MIAAEIVLTGGPCAGKTTALEIIRQEFTTQGYRVLCAPEVATSYILSGVPDINVLAKFNRPAYMALERCMFTTQRMLKGCYSFLAEQMPQDTIVVYDRAEMDILAYTSTKEFFIFLSDLGLTEQDIFDDYDLVIHLTTAADGAEGFYNLDNAARRETSPQDAVLADKNIMQAWIGHDNHVIIDNSTDFSVKMNRVIEEISLLLG